MKHHALPIVLVTLTLAVGCGRQSADAPDDGQQRQPESELRQAASRAATEVTQEAKQQAQEAFANLGRQLVEATPGGGSDALLKNISADLETRVDKLSRSLSANATLQEQLNVGIQALLGNKDVDAVGALNKLTAAKLTPEQSALTKDLYNTAAAFVTQRNFSAIEGRQSEVAQLVNAVWKGDYTQALAPVQKLYSQATLTPAQKDLLGATYDQHLPAGWKDAASTLKQGTDALKKIGL